MTILKSPPRDSIVRPMEKMSGRRMDSNSINYPQHPVALCMQKLMMFLETLLPLLK